MNQTKVEEQKPVRYFFDSDITEWGIGFNVGKTRYTPYQYYFELYFLCFQFIFWFWEKYE